MSHNATLYQIYQCQQCGTAKRRPHQIGDPPQCCGQDMKWRRTATLVDPPAPRFGQAPGIDFRNTNPIHVPIGAGGMYFESLHAIREFEKQSEELAAEGIGQPYRIRGYSQDHSNMSVNTFGTPEEAPPPSFTDAKGRPRFSVKAVDGAAVDDSFAPGATEADASALPLDPI